MSTTTNIAECPSDDRLTPSLDETENASGNTAIRSSLRYRMMVILFVATVLLYGYRLTLSLGDFSDAPHHVINGIFIVDAFSSLSEAAADPMAFAVEYYSHYPAVNLGYYPPVFHMCEAMVMTVLGVSSVSAQITVLLFSIILTYFTFNWLLIRLSLWWAAAGTLLIVSTPFLVYWGRDIMLEIPVLAFVTGAIWLFETLLRAKKPRWMTSIGWAILTALAIWTKQHALVLLPIYAFATVTTKQWAKLRHPAIWVSICIIVIASLSQVYVMMTFIGGDAVGHSIGFTKQQVFDRFNIQQWTFYFDRATQFINWPIIILAGIGAVAVIRHRVRQGSLLLVWLVSFYLMHSYMKAQDVRYACMIIPPLGLLATLGVKYAFSFIGSQPAVPSRNYVAGIAMTLLLGYQLYDTLQVRVPHQATVYRQVANDLSTQMGPFACLSFAPQEPSRLPMLYRLSVESRRNETPNIFDRGSIYRADQILSDWQSRWENVEAMAASLKQWNVKYILVEWPTHMLSHRSDASDKQAIDAILALQEFKEVRQYPVDLKAPRYPVRLTRSEMPNRTLHLYERIKAITFNPKAAPPIRPKRVNFIIQNKTNHDTH